MCTLSLPWYYLGSPGDRKISPKPTSQKCCSYINFTTLFTVQTPAQNILGNCIFVKYGRVTTELCWQIMCTLSLPWYYLGSPGDRKISPKPTSQKCCSYINFTTLFTVQTPAQNILGNRIFVKYGRVTTELCRQMMCPIIQEECH